jgi:vancomycin resistance protein YoaR
MLGTGRVQKRFDRAYSLLAVFALSIVSVMAVYVTTTQLAYRDRIYPGITALGVDLGGLTVEQATLRLNTKLDGYGRQQIEIRAAGTPLSMTASELGFRPRASELARASYVAGQNVPLLYRVAGPLFARPISPRLTSGWDVDQAALAAAVERIAAQIDRPTQEPDLVIGPTVSIRPGHDGLTIDQSRAREIIEQEMMTLQSGTLDLPVDVTKPRVSDAQIEQVRDQAQRILDRPLTLTNGTQNWVVSTDDLRASLVYRQDQVVLSIKPRSFTGILQTIAHQIDRPSRDAGIVIAAGKVQIVPDETGATVDQGATDAAIRQAVLSAQHVASIVVTPLAPSVRSADLADFARQTQQQIDRGVTLSAGDIERQVSGAQLGDLMHVSRQADGTWSVSLDSGKVAQIIADVDGAYRHPSVSTRFNWSDGQVSFLGPSRKGWEVDQPRALRTVLDHWRDGKVTLPVVESATAMDDGYLARLKQDLKGAIEERATSFAGSIPERAHNIALAATRLNGVVVSPGETFSLNQAIGPTTLQAGYQWGFAFSTDSNGNSRTVPSVAGGLCQVASTVFQPVFWSGYEIEERHNHMFWMRGYKDRGYIGLDATVAPDDGVDFKFNNDTDHAMLIQAWTDADQSIHVRLVGTKPDWTVQVDPEQISDVIPAPTQVIRTTSPLFAAGRVILLENAQTGLTSRVTRRVTYPDGHVRTLDLKSVYQPANETILVGTG